MNIDGFQFKLVCNLEPEVGPEGTIQPKKPHRYYNNTRDLPIHAYGSGPFCKFRVPRGIDVAGVYVLVVDRSVRYIGETVNLSDRYNNGYGNISPRNCFQGGQETNCRLNSLIYEEIESGHQIGLWFHATHHHKQVEKRLLECHQPEWNCCKAGQKKKKRFSLKTRQQPSTPYKSFPLVIHKTYYEQGFFNVRVAHADQFGSNGQRIEIFFGRAKHPIVGTINRTAQRNETPRIMGGTGLRNWFRQALSEMQEVTITLLAKTAIRIEPYRD